MTDSATRVLVDGRYRLIRQLGEGTSGVVHLAEDTRDANRPVALKLLRPAADGAARSEGFRREFGLLMRLRHPHIARVRAIGHDAERNQLYLTMDPVSGAAITEAGLGLAELVEVAAQLCRALAFIHARGVVHRDISPRNVLVHDGHAWLVDFGIAATGPQDNRAAGTLQTMAPEALSGVANPSTDLFSLGATLFHALTGTPLHGDDDAAGIVRRLTRPETFVTHVDRALRSLEDERWADVLGRLLAFDPTLRPRSADEVLEALDALSDVAIPVDTPETAEAWVLGSQLVARAEEFAQLSEWIDAPAGRIALIAGDAGTGKSRLLQAVVERAEQAGLRVVSGTARRTTASGAGPIHEAARQALFDAGAGSIAHWGPQLRKVFPEHPSLQRTGQAATLEPRSEGRVRIAALTGVLADATEQGPVLLVLEDTQWMGSSALLALRTLMARVEGDALRVLVTLRWGERAPVDQLLDEANEAGALLRVTMHPFDPSDARAWFDALFGADTASDEVRAAIERVRTHIGGIPLALRETVRRLLERGTLRRVRSRWTLAGPVTVADLPSDTAAAIDARLERLRESPRRSAVLDVLALAIRPLDVDTIRAAAGLAQLDDARVALADLEQRELVTSVADNGGVAWALAHDLFRAPFARHVVRPGEVHLRLANVLASRASADPEGIADALAWHYDHTDRHELAVEWSIRAARAAADRHENARAIELTDRVLRRTPAPPPTDVVAALLIRAAAFRQASRYDEAFATLDSAQPLLDALESPRLTADVMNERASGLHLRGRFNEAEPWAVRAAALYREAGERHGLAEVLGLLGRLYGFQGRYDEAKVALEEEFALVQADASPRRVALAFGHRGTWHLLQFQHDEAAAAYRQQHHIAQSVGDLRQVAIAMGNLGIIHLRAGRYQEALDAFVAAVDACEQAGDRQGMVVGYGNITRCQLLRGDLEAAMQASRRHQALTLETGDQGGRMIAAANLGNLMRATGDYAAAEMHMSEAIAVASERGARPYQGGYITDLAELMAERGRWEDALRHAEEALALLEGFSDHPSRIDARRVAILATAHIDPDETIAAIEGLRTLDSESMDVEQRAAIWADIYQLTGADADRAAASDLYLAAYRERPAPALRRSAIELGADEARFDAGGRRADRTRRAEEDNFEQLMLVVHEISTDVGSRRLLDRIVDATVGFMRAERGVLALYQDDNPEPDFRVVRDREGRDLSPSDVAFSRTVIDRVAETREPVFIANALADAQLAVASSVLALDLRSVMCLPLVAPATFKGTSGTDSFVIIGGTLLGVLYVDSRESTDDNRFSDDNLRYVQALADQAAITLVNGRRYDALSERLNRMSSDIAESMRRLQEEIEVRQRIEHELRRARDAAEEATAVKSRFLAVMSHEIRTPLNGVLGMARLLMDTTLDADQQSYVNMIQTSGDALLSILNNVLDFSKLEAGRVSAENVPIHIGDIVEDAAELLAQRAYDKGVELDAFIDPALDCGRMGDPGRLRQVLLNLLSNAIKFTHEGSVAVIAAPHETEPEMVRIQVVDTGIGVDPLTRDRLFEAFVQGDVSTTRRFGGTGLGLAITRELVHLMGGTIRVESVPDEGSAFTFTIRVPLDPDAQPGPPDLVLAGRRIAHVDHNDVRASHVRALVERAGGRYTGVATGTELLSALSQSPPVELIVADSAAVADVRAALGQRRRSPPMIALVGPGERFRFSDDVTLSVLKPVRGPRLVSALREVLATSDWVQHPTLAGAPSALPRRFGAAQRVLVVEDNAINRVVATKTLEALGFSATTADDGRIAVRAAAAEDFDVVLMDLQMPVMDGIEATVAIRRIPGPRGQVPILAMTASLTDALIRRCEEAGMNGHVSKPIDREQLVDALARAVAQRAESDGD